MAKILELKIPKACGEILQGLRYYSQVEKEHNGFLLHCEYDKYTCCIKVWVESPTKTPSSLGGLSGTGSAPPPMAQAKVVFCPYLGGAIWRLVSYGQFHSEEEKKHLKQLLSEVFEA